MIPHLALRTGRWIRFQSTTHAVTMDGNSIVYGYRKPGPGHTIAQQLADTAGMALYGSGITVTNLGINGQTWQDMLTGLPTFVNGKNNILIAWEGTNTIASGDGVPKTAAQAIAQKQSYIDAVKSANSNWRIVGMTCLPRQGGSSGWGSIAALNAQLDEYNTILRSTYQAMGMEALCDVRKTGGVFDLSGDYSDASFAACDTRAGVSVWLEGANGRIHLKDAGDTVIAGYLSDTLRLLRN